MDCLRRDCAGSSPKLSFDDYAEAKRRLHMRNAPGRDIAPVELLATWGPVADGQVYGFFVARIAGEQGNTSHNQGWAEWYLHSIPKPFRALEGLLTRRPLCHCSALYKLYDIPLWTAVCQSARPGVPSQFGFTAGKQPEPLGCALKKGCERSHDLYRQSMSAWRSTSSRRTWWIGLCRNMTPHHGPLRPCGVGS